MSVVTRCRSTATDDGRAPGTDSAEPKTPKLDEVPPTGFEPDGCGRSQWLVVEMILGRHFLRPDGLPRRPRIQQTRIAKVIEKRRP